MVYGGKEEQQETNTLKLDRVLDIFVHTLKLCAAKIVRIHFKQKKVKG